MAIDADLNSGLIDEDEARRRRKEVAAEADFYGAMDGGTKFVKGDAIAAVIITLVNLIGGFAIGMLQRGMSPGEAINTYSLLSVGDGLVSQIPALLMSVATGVIVTRSTSEGDVGNDLVGQLVPAPRGAADRRRRRCSALCLIPGMPKLPVPPRRRPAAARVARDAGAPDGAGDAAPAAGRRRSQPALPGRGPVRHREPDPVTESLRVDPLELLLAPDLRRPGRPGPRRRPARPGPRPAPQDRPRPGHRAAAGAHPRRRDAGPGHATRSGSAGSPSPTARRRPGTCWPSATPRTACPDGGPPSRCSACPPSGCRSSTGPPPRWSGRRSSSAPPSSPRTWPRWSASTPRACCPWTTSASCSTSSRPSGPPTVEELVPGPAAAVGRPAGAAGAARRAGVDPRPRPGAGGRRPAGPHRPPTRTPCWRPPAPRSARP